MEPKDERDDHVSFSSKAPNGKEDDHHTVVELGNIDMQELLEAGDYQTQTQPYYYVNSLSSWEMDTLTALCDTFLPSVDVSGVTADESVVKFFSTSASMAGTPERVRTPYIYTHHQILSSNRQQHACMLFFSSMAWMMMKIVIIEYIYIYSLTDLIISLSKFDYIFLYI
jgi:hypothetical protein